MSAEARPTSAVSPWTSPRVEPCRYDHHGYCQTHFLDPAPCPHGEPETCEDRDYRCCETLTDAEHEAAHGYPQARA